MKAVLIVQLIASLVMTLVGLALSVLGFVLDSVVTAWIGGMLWIFCFLWFFHSIIEIKEQRK